MWKMHSSMCIEGLLRKTAPFCLDLALPSLFEMLQILHRLMYVRKMVSQDSSIWKYDRTGVADGSVGSSRNSPVLASSYIQ
ncbi:hypothetical protein H5410_041544 [Solanum commersonii]|uniref:Uncharacterized protein n=1 Tax=Solanum commersonii TaxID=4109 RepID=A0A9J5XVT9_SOLCO|nr:hypothetical protein H5410_041544 [Solanum commersonii]